MVEHYCGLANSETWSHLENWIGEPSEYLGGPLDSEQAYQEGFYTAEADSAANCSGPD